MLPCNLAATARSQSDEPILRHSVSQHVNSRLDKNGFIDLRSVQQQIIEQIESSQSCICRRKQQFSCDMASRPDKLRQQSCKEHLEPEGPNHQGYFRHGLLRACLPWRGLQLGSTIRNTPSSCRSRSGPVSSDLHRANHKPFRWFPVAVIPSGLVNSVSFPGCKGTSVNQQQFQPQLTCLSRQ